MKAKVLKDIATSDEKGVIKAGEIIDISPELFNRYMEIGKIEAVEEVAKKPIKSTKEEKFNVPATKSDVEPKNVD